MIYAFEEFKKHGYKVSSLGLFQADDGNIEENDIIVLPVPVTRDGSTVNCPITNAVISLDDVLKKCDGKSVYGGCYNADTNFTDYCALDDYCLLNAVPTAEGAISFAIENTDFTLWKSRVLIIGYGRVGKILCDRLIGMKCDVTVTARKQKDFAFLDALNVKFEKTENINKIKNNYDIIFNTVDISLFDDVSEFPRNTLLIDLSSKGCIDFSKAHEMGCKTFKLPGIPGINAPKTAGKILAHTLIGLIN